MQIVDWLKSCWYQWFPPRSLGERGEAIAAKFLKKSGYKILARSDRSALGELDIVAVDIETLVFVEVKTRTSDRFGLPEEAVDMQKQQKLTRLAYSYLKRNDLTEYAARFDVVSIIWDPDSKSPPIIKHIKNAFEATF